MSFALSISKIMQQRTLYLIMLLVAGMPAFSAEEAKPVREPVGLVVAGDIDAAIVERARSWAEENLAIPVPLRENMAAEGFSTFDEVAEKASSLVASNQLGVVVLWMHGTALENHGAFFPDKKVVIVNMKAMLDAPDTETAARRVERQVIRGICFNMGLELNPNPQSAMFGYTSREELDLIGRNLDPPWLLRVQEKALEYGIPINTDSPQCMIFPPAAEENVNQE